MLTRSCMAWLLALLTTASTNASPLVPMDNKTNSDMVFSFDSLPQSMRLVWTPCWNTYTCANLRVPLDYADNRAGFTTIALVKSEGTPPNAPDALDIFFNPGGPGASGVKFILDSPYFREANSIPPRHNIIGFDPRGVNNSGPSLDCFPGRPRAAATFHAADPKAAANNTMFLSQVLAYTEAYGKWCTREHTHTQARYGGTPAVASDLLRIARLRAHERGQSPDDAKVNYLGASYGSVIGTTFANMFPDQVGRMALTGVVDSETWYSGGRDNAVAEVDSIIEAFFDMCYAAGTKCPFFKNATSALEIGERFNAIMERLEKNPIPVFDLETVQVPVLVTVEHVRWVLFKATYNPMPSFHLVALLMEHLESGDARPFVRYLGLGRVSARSRKLTHKTDHDTFQVIQCLDKRSQSNITTVERYNEEVNYQLGVSKYAGDINGAQFLVMCHAFETRPPVSQTFKGFTPNLKTANPILFFENRLDPVASAGKKMSSFFADSVVLTTDKMGHCASSYGGDSKCMQAYVSKFWENGELPPPDILCKAETDFVPEWAEKKEQKRYDALKLRGPRIGGDGRGFGNLFDDSEE